MEQGARNTLYKLLSTVSLLLLLGAIVLAPCVDATVSEGNIELQNSQKRRNNSWGAGTHAVSSERGQLVRRRLAALVSPHPLVLPYHNGPILSGKNNITKLYIIFYGEFSKIQRYTVRKFLRSLAPPRHRARASIPTVAKWWEITKGFQDVYGESVAQLLIPSGEIQDQMYSRGMNLNQTDIEALVLNSLTTFDISARSLYIVVTASDVAVTGFCQEACGQHGYLYPSDTTGGQMLPYVWVGDASTQCPGLCCWPFANLNYTFMENTQDEPLRPPSGDVGADGMVINLATLIAGAATDPYQNAYYEGDAGAPVEAAEACRGIFGQGAYAGYPGDLRQDNATGVSFNVIGFRGAKFLLPWMWNPMTFACAGQA
ncbi:hypothetical protein M758_6G001900 [Ceratodon purpureus]|nr:hypothetical protein M758_6G001900 [Ceratodon purpureus]